MPDKRNVVIIHETTLQGWVRDSSSAVMFVALIGIGVWLDSDAMQWVGALLGFLVIIGRAVNLADKNKMTVQQARKRLDEIEASFRE